MVAKGLACRNSLILISTILQESWCTKEFLVKDLLLLGEWQLQRYFMYNLIIFQLADYIMSPGNLRFHFYTNLLFPIFDPPHHHQFKHKPNLSAPQTVFALVAECWFNETVTCHNRDCLGGSFYKPPYHAGDVPFLYDLPTKGFLFFFFSRESKHSVRKGMNICRVLWDRAVLPELGIWHCSVLKI